MLQEGNYNILELYPPLKGMNRNIASEALSSDFALALENILPTPLGSATVRYGTKLLEGIDLEADASILEAFPFSLPNGNKQAVLYVREFTSDQTADNFEVLSPNSFQFDTETADAFEIDTFVKVGYTSLGDTFLSSLIVSKTVEGQTVTLTVQDNSFPLPIEDVVINSLSFSKGSLYAYDFETQTLSAPLKTGLSVACVPRSVTFLEKLLICNGVDKVLIWDGETLSDVIDFVKEVAAAQFQRIDDTHFSFGVSPQKASLFDVTKYQNNNQIQLKILGAITTTTVTNIAQAQNVVTITTSDVLPAFEGQIELFYRDWPPAFSFMMTAHNRLWALGAGAAGLSYRDPDQALRVYFSYQSGTVSALFNENTKTVPSINLAADHGSPDNLEAIALLNGLMAFIGRKKTQVWTGSEPIGGAIDPTKPQLEFSSLLPIGIVHGNLMIATSNDLYFISSNGLLSFSTLNIAKQFAATSSDAIDPLIREFVSLAMSSNQDYRACRSFQYPSGAFCGFKIGQGKVLVSMYSANLYAWTVFSGDFEGAQSFLVDGNQALYLCIGSQLYQYADGKGIPPAYGDQDGTALINFLWTPPPIHLQGRRFANKRYEITASYPSSFLLQEGNTIGLVINGDLSQTFLLQNPYPFQFKGDPLGISAFVSPDDVGEDPNEPNPDAIGFRLDEPYAFSKVRLKFVSSIFSVNLVGSTVSGPLNFKKIRLFGIAERS